MTGTVIAALDSPDSTWTVLQKDIDAHLTYLATPDASGTVYSDGSPNVSLSMELLKSLLAFSETSSPSPSPSPEPNPSPQPTPPPNLTSNSPVIVAVVSGAAALVILGLVLVFVFRRRIPLLSTRLP